MQRVFDAYLRARDPARPPCACASSRTVPPHPTEKGSGSRTGGRLGGSTSVDSGSDLESWSCRNRGPDLLSCVFARLNRPDELDLNSSADHFNRPGAGM